MNSKLLIALLFAGLLAFALAHDDDSNGSDSGSESGGSAEKSWEKKDEDCDRMVEGSDDNDGNCDLADGIDEAADDCDECSDDEKVKIKDFTKKLRIKLFVKVSIEERLSIALSELEQFQIECPICYENIQYSNVSSFGYLASFSKVVQYRLMTKLERLITLDEFDNCPLFDALLNGTEGSIDQEAACNALINETLIDICANDSLSVKEKQVAIFKALEVFFSINAEWQTTFFKFKIQGFGSFQSFFEVVRTRFQVTKVDEVLEGEFEQSEFWISFERELEIIFKGDKIDTSMKSILMQFKLRIKEKCKTKTTGKGRLMIIMNEFRALFKLYSTKQYKIMIKLTMSIQISGFGSFFDLINCGPIRNPIVKPTVMIPMTTPKCSCTCEGSTTLSA